LFDQFLLSYLQLSLFKRSSTKGNRAESSASGKPADDGPPQISETRGPESSSSRTQIGDPTTASSRSPSATCNLLWHLSAGFDMLFMLNHLLNWKKETGTKTGSRIEI